MSRSVDERIADVRGVLAAANAVYRDRAAITADIERSTGLSKEGVELGFDCLEREATEDDLRALVDGAGDAPRVHVILSANVFVAPLRAIAIARAASGRVTVSPSSREPTFVRALVAAARDPRIAIVADRDAAISESDRTDVYGRDETVAEVRARARASAVVRGHGAGLGVAIVAAGGGGGDRDDGEDAADALAADVVAFDQRGCLSPRVVFVEGPVDRASAFASSLSERLTAWGARVPRGALTDAERADAVRWRDALSFVGHVWIGADHVVALAPPATPLAVPPSGRHVLVVSVRSLEDLATQIGPIRRFVVSIGTNDPSGVRPLAPAHARVVALGRMQRPALDGPVDGRASESR